MTKTTQTELATTQPSALAKREGEPTLMQIIADVVMSGKATVDVMERLLDMQFKVEARNSEVEFNAALARLMPKVPRIEKHGVIKVKGEIRSKFAKYEDIDYICRPILAEEGMSISFDTDDSTPGKLKIIGVLSHALGFSRTTHITLPVEGEFMSKQQIVGSVVSFGKRYCYINLLNIVTVDEDNDGRPDEITRLSPDEVMTIHTMISDAKIDLAKFFDWLGYGDKLEDIFAHDVKKVTAMLQAKLRSKA